LLIAPCDAADVLAAGFQREIDEVVGTTNCDPWSGCTVNLDPSPQGVLRLRRRELLFGEARVFTARIVLLFDWGGEEK